MVYVASRRFWRTKFARASALASNSEYCRRKPCWQFFSEKVDKDVQGPSRSGVHDWSCEATLRGTSLLWCGAKWPIEKRALLHLPFTGHVFARCAVSSTAGNTGSKGDRDYGELVPASPEAVWPRAIDTRGPAPSYDTLGGRDLARLCEALQRGGVRSDLLGGRWGSTRRCRASPLSRQLRPFRRKHLPRSPSRLAIPAETLKRPAFEASTGQRLAGCPQRDRSRYSS